MKAHHRSIRASAMRARAAGGTRFRLFPVFAEDMPPETVEIPSVAGTIGPGPSDHALYVADAAGKTEPYGPPQYGPPFRGPLLPPAQPDREGHFDHLPIESPQFLAAHQFGSMRYTLDIWERYLGHRVEWWGQTHPSAYRAHSVGRLAKCAKWPGLSRNRPMAGRGRQRAALCLELRGDRA